MRFSSISTWREWLAKYLRTRKDSQPRRLKLETLEDRSVPATLLGWDFNGLSNYGSSPFSPTTTDTGITSVVGLTRGSGVGTSGTAAANAWGGNDWVSSTLADAVTAGDVFTFGFTVAAGQEVDLNEISAFNIRRSSTGPTTYQFQYSVGSGSFVDIGSSITIGSTTTSAGNAQSAISLSGISGLQNLAAGTQVTFRGVLWGGSGSAGTGYLNNFQTGNDFILDGTVTPASSTPSITTNTADRASNAATLIINGSNFDTATPGNNVVTLSSGAATVTAATATSLTLSFTTAPDLGNLTASVTNGNGTSNTAQVATIVNPPSITASTANINTLTNTLVINGSNFSTTAANNSVSFNLGAVGTITAATATSLTVEFTTLPSIGNLTATVTSNGGVSNTAQVATVQSAPSISYGTVASTYSQNFNGLVNTGTVTVPNVTTPIDLSSSTYGDSTLSGWYFSRFTGTGSTTFFVNNGSNNAGGAYSYGTGTDTDRALGLLGSGSNASRIGAVFVNDTGSTLEAIRLAFTGEQWRRGNGAANTLGFEYALGGTGINGSGFTAFTSLDFTAPVTTGTDTALNGNDAANRSAISATLTGINWTAGQTLVIRWNDTNDTGNDDGLAVDDFSLQAFARPTVTASTTNVDQDTTTLVINGSNFSPVIADNSISLSSGAATITAATATSLTLQFTTPPSLGALSVAVTSNGLTSSTTQIANIVQFPEVTANTANLLQNATTITIAGANFSTTPANNTVTFNLGATGTVTSATATSLTVTFTIPPALGNLTAVVTTNGLSSGSPVQVATITAVPFANQVFDNAIVPMANIRVNQLDTLNNTTSVQVGTDQRTSDFQIRTGSNRGDYNIQIGSSGTDDVANGILITSVRQNGRNNDEGGVRFATSSIDADANGYYIPIHDSPGGNEYNIDVAAAYFPYADWIGGWARNSTNNGPITSLTGTSGLTLGTHFIDNGGGVYTVDLRSFGVHSQRDGVLMVVGGKNEDNFALSRANADGTWTLFVKDNGDDGSSTEADPIGFVYIPNATGPSFYTPHVSGRLNGNAMALMANGRFTAREIGGGQYYLEIDGYTPNQGVLLISPEGGQDTNVDNIVTYQASGNGWIIQTRDLPSSPPGLQDLGNNPMLSFVFLPFEPKAATPLGAIPAGELIVVQNDAGNGQTSVSVSLGTTTGGMIVGGSTGRGDIHVLMGQSPAGNTNISLPSNVAGGILITSVAQNTRDNTGAGGPTGSFGTTGIDIDSGVPGTYFIPTHRAGDQAGGTEFNINVSAGYFSYADGWIGAMVNNSAGTNGGANNQLASAASGLVLGTHIIDNGSGQTTIDLTSLGISSQSDGILLVNHAKNGENNFALSRPNANGTWTIFVKDGGTDGAAYEQDPIAFVYVPGDDGRYISGRILGNASIVSATRSGEASVTNPSTGVFRLTIPGHTPQTGVLLVSPEGGSGNNVDNLVTFQPDGDGWLINTRDLPNLGLQNIGATDGVASFIFLPRADVGIDNNGNVYLANNVENVDNRYTISRVGNNLRIRDDARTLTAARGMIQIDHNTVEIPLADITGEILVNTQGGADRLIVDTTGGALPEIRFNGGTGNDLLVVRGSTSQTATYTPDAAITGNGIVTTSAGTITFVGLEPVDITGFGTATLDLPGGDDVLTLSAGTDYDTGSIDALRVSGTSGGVAIESVAFYGNTTVVIDTTVVDGDDTLTLASADNAHGNTNLQVNTGVGADTVAIDGPLVFAGSIEISTAEITGTGDVETGTGFTLTITTDSILDGVISGTGGLTKQGTARLTLSADSTYTGATTVAEGTLRVMGSLTSDVTVEDAALLEGTGSITGCVASTGTGQVNPGTSPGILTITGDYSANTTFEINAPYTTAGTDYDQLIINGATSVIDLSAASVTFVSLGGGTVPALPSLITLILNNGSNAITPFANLAQGATVTLGSGGDARTFIASYTGGDGNDLVLFDATAPTTLYIDDSFSGSLGQSITDADLGTAGDQGALFGVNAFTSIAAAQAAYPTYAGVFIVNGGTYAATTLANGQDITVTGVDAAQTATFAGLTTASGEEITIQGSSVLGVEAGTLAGLLTGSGSLTKSGLGTLLLSAANTFTGGVTHNAGSLILSNETALGTGTLTLNATGVTSASETPPLGFRFADGSSVTIANNIVLPASGDTTFGIISLDPDEADNITVTLSGVISGGSAAGIFRLDSDQSGNHSNAFRFTNTSNTYTGTVEMWRGTFAIVADGSLGVSSNGIRHYTENVNGSLRFDADNIELAATRGIFFPGSANARPINTQGFTATILGPISGNGNLIKQGSGTLILGGTNTYVGTTTVEAGILRVQGGSAIPDASAITLNGSANLDLTASETIGSLASASTTTTVTLGANTLTTGGNNGSTTFAGTISGTGSLVKQGTGAFVLSAANTYTGGTTHNAGSLILSNETALGTGTLTINATGLTDLSETPLLGFRFADGSNVTVANAIVLPNGNATFATVSLDPNEADNVTVTLSGVISGGGASGRLRFDSDQSGNHTNTLRLTNTGNTFVALIDMWRGSLGITADAVLGDATNDIRIDTWNTAGALRFENAMTLGAGRDLILASGGQVLPVNTLGNDVTVQGNLTGPGRLTKQGAGTLTFGTANSWQNAQGINIVAGNVSTPSQTLTSTRTVAIASGSNLTSTGVLSFDNLTTAGAGFAGANLVITGAGTLQLRQTGGGTFASPDLFFSPNGVGSADYAARIETLVDLGSEPRFLRVNTNQNDGVDYGGDLQLVNVVSGTGGLTIHAAPNGSFNGSVALYGNNTFTGGVTVERGFLLSFNSGSLNSSTPNALTISPASGNTAGLYLYGRDLTVADLNATSAGTAVVRNGSYSTGMPSFIPTNSPATLTVVSSNDTTFNGIFSDGPTDDGNNPPTGGTFAALNLAKTGPATLTLTGANTYSGTTTISTGTLQIGNGGGTGTLGTGTVTTNASLVFNRNNAYTVANLITGTGTLTQQGTGITTLTANNTYAGTTTVNAGTLLINGVHTGTGLTTVNSGGTLGGTGTLASEVSVLAGGTLSPGTSPGIFTSGSITYVSTSNFAVEIDGTTPGTGHDQHIVNGTVDLGGATLALSGPLLVTPGTLQTIVIIANDDTDAVIGTFDGLAEGAPIPFNGGTLFLSYVGGDGNDVVLTSQLMGSAADDILVVRQDGSDPSRLEYSLNGAAFLSVPADVPFTFNGLGGNDILAIDLVNGAVAPTGGLFFNGGLGTDRFQVRGTGSETATYSPSSTTANAGTVTIATTDVSTFDAVENVDLFGFDTVELVLANVDNSATLTETTAPVATTFIPATPTLGSAAALSFTGTTNSLAFASLAVWNNTTVAVTSGTGADTFILDGGTNAHANANLSIDTATGADSITVLADLTVTGSLDFASQAIALDGGLLTANDVSLDAGIGAITTVDASLDIDATDLVLIAGTGIGSLSNSLTTTVSNLEAESDTGGIYLANTGDLTIGGVNSSLTGVKAPTSGDIVLTNVGSIFVTLGGETIQAIDAISVTATGATSDIVTGGDNGFFEPPTFGNLGAIGSLSGSVRLDAGQDLLLGSGGYGDVAAGGGMNLTAGRDIVVSEDTLVETFNTTALVAEAGQDILLTGSTGGFGPTFQTNGGTIELIAGRDFIAEVTGLGFSVRTTFGGGSADITITADRNIEIGETIDAGASGDVFLIALNGAITDGNGTSLNVTASGLSLFASTGIGSSSDSLETAVSNLEAQSDTGGIFLSNTGDLTIGDVDPFLSGVKAPTSGDIVLTNVGSIFVTLGGETIQAIGDISVTATGATSNIVTGGNNGFFEPPTFGNLGAIGSLSGSVTLDAGQDLLLGSGGFGDVAAGGGMNLTAGRDIVVSEDTLVETFNTTALVADAGQDIRLTGATGGFGPTFQTDGGTIDLTAGRDFLAEVTGLGFSVRTTFGGGNGDITITADRDIQIGELVDAGSANVVLTATTGAIVDLNGTANNVTGATVLLQAATGIGTAAEPFEIDAGTLAFTNSTSGDVFLRHIGAGLLSVNDIGTVTASSNTGGGEINLFANAGLEINHDISTVPMGPPDGTLIVGGGVTFNAAITVGQGDITLDGNGDDIVISGPTVINVNTIFNPNRDILINADLSTTGTANLGLFAGKGYSGVGAGGVRIASGATVSAAGDLTIRGKDLFVTSTGTPDSILIEAGGAIEAAGDITLAVNSDALAPNGGPAPVNARTILNGTVSNTTGDINISAAQAIELNTDVTSTGGTVSFNSPVILTGTSSVSNDGTITFASTVDGANDLSVDAGSGTTTFDGALGATTPLGDGTGAALTIAGGAATFNGTVATASGIVQEASAGLVTFNEDVTITGGDTASSFAGNVTLDGLTFQTIDQDASFTGSTLTLAGSTGVTLRVGGTSAHTITVDAQVVGPVATALNIWTNPASAVILTNADNTYAGLTNINNGRLTVNGQLSATGSPSTVTLVGPDTVLDGSGTLRQRSVVVASTANNASIQGVSIQGAGTGTGIGVRVDSSRANLGGDASGVGVDSLTIQGWNIGVQVNGASARAAIVGLAGDRNVITDNRIGVDVNMGRALIELTDLSNNTRSGTTDGSSAAGLRVRGNARVDAGQGFGGFDFTELGTGGVGGGSEGDNVFDGYTTYTGSTVPTVPQAILNLSNTGLNAVAGPQGAPTDVYAQYNSFNGSTALASIEPLVWHDYDASARGFVNYARPSSLTPTTVGNVRLIAGTDSALQTNNYTQASMVRIARVSFDNYVSIQMSDPNPANRALVITRVGDAFNATAVNPGVTTINAQTGAIRFDPFSPEGRYFNYDLTFSGPGVELSGSLQDGDYTLSFDASKVQSFVNLTPPGQNVPGLQGGSGITTLEFHRLFGDVDGNRVVDSMDQVFLNATMRSRRGMANFYEYLNFDWNSVIDTQDQTAFNRRFNRY